MCVGDSGDRIGDAGPRSHQSHSQAAGYISMGVRHMYCGAFVTDIDNLNAFEITTHPDRHDMAAAEPKYPVNSL